MPALSLPLRFSLCFCLCLLLGSCEGDTRNRRAARGDDFVSDPDHLFFKNTRSRDYRSETLAEGVEAYYHDELTESASYVIVDYWLEDRAELRKGGEVISLAGTRVLKDSLQRQDRSAALEVIEDYLRMTGH